MIWAIRYLPLGIDKVTTADNTPPYSVILIALVLAVLRIVSASGVWQGKRWGIVVAVIANAVDALAAVPGILFAPTQELWISALASVVVGIVVIALCFWRGKPVAM